MSALYSKSLVYCMGRTIKEQKFQVHPNILSCLLHLRLRGELDALRQGKNSRSNGKGRDRAKGDVAFKSEVRKKWQTKNQKKREKELKEVAKEMAEAEAEVDKEVRAQTVRQKTLSFQSMTADDG